MRKIVGFMRCKLVKDTGSDRCPRGRHYTFPISLRGWKWENLKRTKEQRINESSILDRTPRKNPQRLVYRPILFLHITRRFPRGTITYTSYFRQFHAKGLQLLHTLWLVCPIHITV